MVHFLVITNSRFTLLTVSKSLISHIHQGFLKVIVTDWSLLLESWTPQNIDSLRTYKPFSWRNRPTTSFWRFPDAASMYGYLELTCIFIKYVFLTCYTGRAVECDKTLPEFKKALTSCEWALEVKIFFYRTLRIFHPTNFVFNDRFCISCNKTSTC